MKHGKTIYFSDFTDQNINVPIFNLTALIDFKKISHVTFYQLENAMTLGYINSLNFFHPLRNYCN